MLCPQCSTPNAAQARFCLACGFRLVGGVICSTCHTLLPNHARFCSHCGDMIVAHAQQPTITQVAPQPTQPVEPATQHISDLLTSLRPYLPDALYEPLERRPTDKHLIEVRDHLVQLLRTSKTYLPAPVITDPQPAGEAAGGMVEGAFIFVDVTGFTALSERLSVLGRAGAERVTDIMNDLFFDLVGVLMEHGGTLLKFGGDAILGVFDSDDTHSITQQASKAVQTAFAMQSIMGKFYSIEAAGETSALAIKVGVACGEYFAAHIGTPDNMGYVTTGHTVNRVEQCEDHAEAGEIIIAQDTLDHVGAVVDVTERAEGFYHAAAFHGEIETTIAQSHEVPADDDPPGDHLAQIGYLAGRMQRLAPYLAADLLPRIVTNPDDVVIDAEHRPVTVMFANYVGIADLIEDMGHSRPDIITARLNEYFVHMAEIVEKYEGTLARMDHYAVGNRLVIFFGAPRAHEDDPVRAVYTALEMREETKRHFAALQTPEGIYRFQQRIGINTGHLFAGNVGAPNLRQEYTLMGDDINMAARLMSKADWHEVFISKATQQRVAAFFDLEDKGELKVKGKEILIPTYSVKGRRSEIGQTRGLATGQSPLTGRDEELGQISQAGQTLMAGRGQIVTIIGDSGRGKSRLVREFKAKMMDDTDDNPRWLEATALSFSEQVSYWLMAQLLTSVLDHDDDPTPDETLYNLWELGDRLLGRENAREAIPFLAYMLDLELEGDWADVVAELDPGARQKQTLWAAREFYAALAEEQPTVIVLDDLHWADEASLAMIKDLLAITDRALALFVLVFRERRDKDVWGLRDLAAGTYNHRYTQIDLAPLTDEQSIELLSALLPGATFDEGARRKVLDKAMGNPFYLEEVVRTLIDAGAVKPDDEGQWTVTDDMKDIAVPDSLQSAIVSRIDRLTEDARQALQMAAVIGRRFQLDIIRSMAEAEDDMEMWLAQLERSGMVRPTDMATYNFQDTLVQEVAYDSLLVQRRQEFHSRIAQTLEQSFADDLSQAAEMLAYHYARSPHTDQAITYLKMAGDKAHREYANATALQHYNTLMAIFDREDVDTAWVDAFDTLNQRQKVYGLLGQQTEREEDLKRMLALTEAHADDDRRGDALNGLADLYQWTGRYDEAIEVAQEALSIEKRTGDRDGQSEALHQMGVVRYYKGAYDEAEPALRQAAELRSQTGDAIGESWSRLYLTMINLMAGNYSLAADHTQQALAKAEERQDWMMMGIHLNNAARIDSRLGKYQEALEGFQRSFDMRGRIGDRTGQGFTLHGKGMIHIALGELDEAEAKLTESMAVREAINDERGISYCLYGLGLVALERQDSDAAVEHLGAAREIQERLNLHGELIATISHLGQAALLRGSIEAAQAISQQAVDMLAEHPDIEEVQQIYLNHYGVLQAAGKLEAAQAALHEAQQRVEEQAAAIKDEATRETFLTQVKTNRKIQDALEDNNHDNIT